MIDGFLHADGRKILDGSGREILLKGWGLGNWLLQEGYMWCISEKRFDRPRRIEKVVEELTGKEYAASFWQQYRRNYVKREDILQMAQLGYNSVRIPFNYRLFMEEGTNLKWKQEGFDLLDNCLSWCEEAGIYAFLDLHGAPGGQTGSNIDDSIDDTPRMFLDREQWDKTLALWVKLAKRYSGRQVVGGYDLLNEPIAPPNFGNGDFDFLIPRLKEFYMEAVAQIRHIDKNHLLSIEGAHWATDLQIFDRKYDDNMVLHFHRYAEIPEYASLKPYIKKAEELDVPLWMGETGENVDEWYSAFYSLAESLGIGYNLWPWKKMGRTNSPYSIKEPKDYELLKIYLEQGSHPGYRKAQKIFDEYLENIKIENCQENTSVTCHVLRRIPFSIRATDFDEYPGKGIAFSGNGEENEQIAYRHGCGMELVELHQQGKKRFAFDCQWDRYGLLLREGEFVCYHVDVVQKAKLTICFRSEAEPAFMQVAGINGIMKENVCIEKGRGQITVFLPEGVKGVKIMVTEGRVCAERLIFSNGE